MTYTMAICHWWLIQSFLEINQVLQDNSLHCLVVKTLSINKINLYLASTRSINRKNNKLKLKFHFNVNECPTDVYNLVYLVFESINLYLRKKRLLHIKILIIKKNNRKNYKKHIVTGIEQLQFFYNQKLLIFLIQHNCVNDKI